MLLAKLDPGSLPQWIEVGVQVGGLLGALSAWAFSRRCRINVTLHMGGYTRALTSTPTGTTFVDRTAGALVVENVGSRIGRGVKLSADPPLVLVSRPSGNDSPPIVLDDWELGDMSPAQRYEFTIELNEEAHLERLMGSDLTVSRKRGFMRDYTTTIRIGGSGLRDVSLEDSTSPAGMVADRLSSIQHTISSPGFGR